MKSSVVGLLLCLFVCSPLKAADDVSVEDHARSALFNLLSHWTGPRGLMETLTLAMDVFDGRSTSQPMLGFWQLWNEREGYLGPHMMATLRDSAPDLTEEQQLVGLRLATAGGVFFSGSSGFPSFGVVALKALRDHARSLEVTAQADEAIAFFEIKREVAPSGSRSDFGPLATAFHVSCDFVEKCVDGLVCAVESLIFRKPH